MEWRPGPVESEFLRPLRDLEGGHAKDADGRDAKRHDRVNKSAGPLLAPASVPFIRETHMDGAAVAFTAACGRGRLVRALLLETTVLSVLGGAVGLVLAEDAIRAVRERAHGIGGQQRPSQYQTNAEDVREVGRDGQGRKLLQPIVLCPGHGPCSECRQRFEGVGGAANVVNLTPRQAVLTAPVRVFDSRTHELLRARRIRAAAAGRPSRR